MTTTALHPLIDRLVETVRIEGEWHRCPDRDAVFVNRPGGRMLRIEYHLAVLWKPAHLSVTDGDPAGWHTTAEFSPRVPSTAVRAYIEALP